MFPANTPMKPDELRELVEAIRKECWGNSSNLREIVPVLRTNLREFMADQQGRGRADARLAARYIVKPLIICARLQEDSARNALGMLNRFNERVLGHTSAASKGKFTL